MGQKETDLQRIKALVEIMKANDLVEIEIKQDDDKILLKRAQPQAPQMTAMPVMQPQMVPAQTQQAGGETAAPEAKSNLIEIKSPIVGTFYATPAPDADPFVDVGSNVSDNTVVCIIEAMKVMNEIKAECSGTIAEVLCKNGQAVEFGQPLFRVKPN